MGLPYFFRTFFRLLCCGLWLAVVSRGIPARTVASRCGRTVAFRCVHFGVSKSSIMFDFRFSIAILTRAFGPQSCLRRSWCKLLQHFAARAVHAQQRAACRRRFGKLRAKRSVGAGALASPTVARRCFTTRCLRQAFGPEWRLRRSLCKLPQHFAARAVHAEERAACRRRFGKLRAKRSAGAGALASSAGARRRYTTCCLRQGC